MLKDLTRKVGSYPPGQKVPCFYGNQRSIMLPTAQSILILLYIMCKLKPKYKLTTFCMNSHKILCDI